MVERLQQWSRQPVQLVPVSKAEWLLTVFAFGWARILDRVHITAAALARHSPTGRVTLIGHSSGGIMLRLFLDDAPFQGRRYDGKALADRLVMLGSPHTALKATALRQMVQRRLPGSALLEGSTPLVLTDVAHGGAFGADWYGSPEVVDRWWL
jgi:alpha-beta hydrolase superfamily lysophospholipase